GIEGASFQAAEAGATVLAPTDVRTVDSAVPPGEQEAVALVCAAFLAAGGVPLFAVGGFLLTLPTGGLATRAARTATALPPAPPAAPPPAIRSPDTRAECRAAGFMRLGACVRGSEPAAALGRAGHGGVFRSPRPAPSGRLPRGRRQATQSDPACWGERDLLFGWRGRLPSPITKPKGTRFSSWAHPRPTRKECNIRLGNG